MIAEAWAQSGGAGSAAPSALIQMAPLLLVFVVFYFLLIRPQQLKQKEHGVMLANLKKNDDVVTSGGIYGKVIALADNVVTLEVAPNVRIKVDRQQIASIAGVKKNGSEGKDKEKDKES
jgi:preprotein translocase subunit YajC